MPDVPILGRTVGNEPPNDLYVPGREYEAVVQLASGEELTVRIGFNFPPAAVPNPFNAEFAVASWAMQCMAQGTLTRSQEGPWVAWRNVAAVQFLGAVGERNGRTDRGAGRKSDTPETETDTGSGIIR
jgi:hypothetical protein